MNIDFHGKLKENIKEPINPDLIDKTDIQEKFNRQKNPLLLYSENRSISSCIHLKK